MSKKKEKPIQGRPTKYKEEYDQMLIDHMEEGFTFESFAGVVSVDRDTLYHWCTLHPNFSDAKKIGRNKQLFTDEKLLKALSNGAITGSTSAHIFKMKNCHKWVDKHEVAIKDISDEELLNELKDVLPSIKAD